MLLNGKAPLPGQIMQFPDLAKTFRSVAESGKDGFYKGRIAEAIVELIQSKGGLMELDDLAKHETSFVEPLSYTYQEEVTVYEVSLSTLDTMIDEIVDKICYSVSTEWSRCIAICFAEIATSRADSIAERNNGTISSRHN